MRIALVGDEFYPGIGGVASYTMGLGEALAKLGVDPVVITHAYPGHPNKEKFGKLEVIRLNGFIIPGAGRALSISLGKKLHEKLKFGDFDVVHGQDIFSSMALQSVYSARRCKLPSVLTCHSIHETSGFWKFVYKPIVITMRKAARVIAVSSAVRKFCEALGVSPKKMRVVLNGCNLSISTPKNPDSIRRKFGIGEGPLIVSVLRLIKRKGPQFLVQAFPRIRREITQAKLIIVGAGREGPALYQLAEELKVKDSVRFLGVLPHREVLELIAAADVFVLPSTIEACPLALLESMALGTPVVCTAVGGVPEVIKDGLNGLMVPPADPLALAEAVIQILKDDKVAARIRMNELKTVREGFSWERVAKQTLEVYEEASEEYAKSRVYS